MHIFNIALFSAPSDSPHNVNLVNVDEKNVTLSFEPPKIPNGIISRYVAYYNKTDGVPHQKVFRTKEILHANNVLAITLVDYMSYYSNYSIQLEACVDQACSEKSEPVYAFTGISSEF